MADETPKTPSRKTTTRTKKAETAAVAVEPEAKVKKPAAVKTATKTPAPAADKPAAEKKAPVAKKPAAAKTATPRKTAEKKAPAKTTKITAEQRYRMVAEAAYYRAESCQFKSDPLRDWIEAERDIAILLREIE